MVGPLPCYVLFVGARRFASGSLEHVARVAHRISGTAESRRIVCYSEVTGRPQDLGVRGTETDVAMRYSASGAGVDATPRGRGRPKLGALSREVSLLPRHWSWLESQRAGASAAGLAAVMRSWPDNIGTQVERFVASAKAAPELIAS